MLPLAGLQPFGEWRFWLGLCFVTFPLNFVVYGLDDLADREADRANPRKGGWWLGARGSDEQLRSLPLAIGVVAAVGVSAITLAGGVQLLLVFAALALVLFACDHPTRGVRGRPPLQLACPVGYLLVVPIAIDLVGAPALPWPTFVYLGLFAVQSELIGEILDVEADRSAGRRTTATVLGPGATRRLLIGVVALEILTLLVVYRDPWLAGMLGVGLAALVLDAARPLGRRPHTLTQMRLFGLGANAAALASMIYVWWSGCLLEVAW
jgi:4-hydroxybenzoate polyprenyltransferase